MKLRIMILIILFISAGTHSQNSIDSRIEDLLQADFLSSSEVGISVIDLTIDSILYQYQSAKRYHPASTQKLITCISAIHYLGENYPVLTKLGYDGELNGGVLEGNLYVIGGFDSEFGLNEMTQLIGLLSNQGIHTIQGKIYGDISMKDTIPYGAGWCWDDALKEYQPVLSPLMYNKGYVNIHATPSRKGEPAHIKVVPTTEIYRIENQTLSNEPNAGLFEVSRNIFSSSQVITVSGNVSHQQQKTITVPRPQDLFMSVFLTQLHAKGIQHSGFAGYREFPHDKNILGSIHRPLPELVRRALKVSDNLSAEAIFYQVARYWKGDRCASSENAISAINNLMLDMGLHADSYAVTDGSGLSRYNYVTADMLVDFLRFSAYNQSIMNVLYPALPIAGVDGTLRNRMKNGLAYNNVRAKTGTITGASSLAGYLTASNGHLIAFAIVNQNMKNGRDARAWQDRLCEILCK